MRTVDTMIMDSDKALSIVEKVACIGGETYAPGDLIRASRGKWLQKQLKPRGEVAP